MSTSTTEVVAAIRATTTVPDTLIGGLALPDYVAFLLLALFFGACLADHTAGGQRSLQELQEGSGSGARGRDEDILAWGGRELLAKKKPKQLGLATGAMMQEIENPKVGLGKAEAKLVEKSAQETAADLMRESQPQGMLEQVVEKRVTETRLHFLQRSSVIGFRKPQSGQRCAIYMLDLNQLAQDNKLPVCNISDVISDKITQVPFLRSFAELKKYPMAPHYFTANAGPYFLQQLLLKSSTRTSNPDDADMVYVDDYCYKMWWLASVHSLQTPEDEQRPGQVLLDLYAKMMELPLWKKHNGRNFVFFQSHTGFARFAVGNKYEDLLCKELVSSHHFVNTRANRYRCPQYDEKRLHHCLPLYPLR
eukprot:jgi/Botrbrau1/22153/Bobra.0206s0076.1